MNAMIVYKQDQFRLITDGNGRFAVVEARAGKVYSLHAQGRREAQDTEGGMELALGTTGRHATRRGGGFTRCSAARNTTAK